MTDIDALRARVNKQLGSDVMKRASDPYFATTYLPTGVLPIDVMLGGGFPVGRSLEIYGAFSSLKSWIALKGIAQTQLGGKTCALIDSEHAFDPVWAEACGVDTKELIVVHPNTGEEAVAVTEVLVRDGIGLVIWDSVAAMQPKAESEKMPGEDKQPARRASMMSKGLSRLTAANKNTTALVFINQTRTNVGMTFGPSETSPGGKALPFYASMRLRMAQAGKVTRDVQVHNADKMASGKEIIGYRIKSTLEKSKLNRPHREMWFVFSTETGEVDVDAWLIAQGEEIGIVTSPSKGWLSIPELYEGKFRRKEAHEIVATDIEAREFFEHKIKQEHGLEPADEADQ